MPTLYFTFTGLFGMMVDIYQEGELNRESHKIGAHPQKQGYRKTLLKKNMIE